MLYAACTATNTINFHCMLIYFAFSILKQYFLLFGQNYFGSWRLQSIFIHNVVMSRCHFLSIRCWFRCFLIQIFRCRLFFRHDTSFNMFICHKHLYFQLCMIYLLRTSDVTCQSNSFTNWKIILNDFFHSHPLAPQSIFVECGYFEWEH